MKYPRTTLGRKYPKRSLSRKRLSKKPKNQLVTKAAVKHMLDRRIENKINYGFVSADIISNSLLTSPYFQQINYTCAQGLGQGGRIGNRVNHKAASLKGSIAMRDYNSLSNSKTLPQLVTLVVFKVKNYQTGINPTYTNFFSQIFQTGSTTTSFTNTPIDHIRKLNTDIMEVKAVRKFKMGYSGFFTSNNATQVAAPGTNNNDFKYQQYFNINLSKFYKKNQQWNDVDSDAHNDNLFFMVFACPADSSAFTSSPLIISWDLEQVYEDA